MRRSNGGLAAVLAGATLACVPAAPPPAAPGFTDPAGEGAPGRVALVPAGRGTLRQDEFTISLRDGALLIKVTPLAEPVIRLAAPDTYERLHALAESRRVEAASRSGEAAPELFLVSFFSYEPDTPFSPEDLQLFQQGRIQRPRAILPLTPGWGAQLVQRQDVQTALYVFASGLDLELPLLVRYGSVESGEWDRIVERLRVERAKFRGRERADGEPE